jgi:hypothetical protein
MTIIVDMEQNFGFQKKAEILLTTRITIRLSRRTMLKFIQAVFKSLVPTPDKRYCASLQKLIGYCA